MTLQTFALGRTDLRLPILGFGSAPIGDLYGPIPEAQAIETIQFALECGVNLLDTSPWYGAGLAESRMGLALRGVPRDRFVLSSKVGHLIDGSGGFDFSRDGVLRSIEGSLKRLGVDRLDIVHLHDPDDHEREALEFAFPVLAELRDQGVIRAVGAGVNRWQTLERFASADFDCFMLAGRYTLLEQDSLGLLDLCAQKNIAVLLGGVFNSGILATGAKPGAKYHYQDAPPEILERVRMLEAIGGLHQVSLKAIALQFPLAHPAVASLVVGATHPHEIEENLSALHEPIPAQLWMDLRLEGSLSKTSPTPNLIAPIKPSEYHSNTLSREER
jgi:D-threo-aldose 1-dehydrogenase